MSTCPHCGGETVTPDRQLDIVVRYADTPGGHADRHTLVTEAAERLVEEASRRGAL